MGTLTADSRTTPRKVGMTNTANGTTTRTRSRNLQVWECVHSAHPYRLLICLADTAYTPASSYDPYAPPSVPQSTSSYPTSTSSHSTYAPAPAPAHQNTSVYSTSSSHSAYAPTAVNQSTSAYPTPTSSHGAYAPAAVNQSTVAYPTSTSSYNSYAPPSVPQSYSSYSNNGPAAPNPAHHTRPSSTDTTLAYDPYKPSAAPSDPYAKSAAVQPGPAHNAYSSPSRLSGSGSHYMMYSSPSQSSAQSPPPPKPVVRPAVANAYDPPVLVTRSQKQRAASQQANFASPPPQKALSGSYGAPSAHSLHQQPYSAVTPSMAPSVSAPMKHSSGLGAAGTSPSQPNNVYGQAPVLNHVGEFATSDSANSNTGITGSDVYSRTWSSPATDPHASAVSDSEVPNWGDSHLERASSGPAADSLAVEEGNRGDAIEHATPESVSEDLETPIEFGAMTPSTVHGPSPNRQQSTDSLASDYPASVPLPPSRTLSPASERAKSPASVYSSYNDEITYQPLHADEPLTAKPGNVVQHYDPYRPAVNGQYVPTNGLERTSSPLRHSVPSVDEHSAPNPYLPSTSTTGYGTATRARSVSNSSQASDTSAVNDPYAPSQHPSRRASQASDYGAYTPAYNYAPTVAASQVAPAVSNTSSYSLVQEVSLPAPTYAPYVPSPSLSGTNDPLGRARARIPLVHFGWGGKVVTCFHSSPTLETGFDVAVTSRHSTDVLIRPLHALIPRSALETSDADYPGPLFSDPGTPTIGLVRTGATAQTKNKKARVLKYLEERATELSQGLGYLQQTSPEVRRAEGKLALVNLLKVMVDNDGRLSGRYEIFFPPPDSNSYPPVALPLRLQFRPRSFLG